MFESLDRHYVCTFTCLNLQIFHLNNLKRDELVLSRFNNEIEKQINLVVKKFSNDRENVAKYVNCMKLATKQHWMPEITQEIKVPASSTLHQCINTEISKYNALWK
ncbi:unnamed protein product [Schistosoma intercalatum]|nr:unnamed protein product [Schistosoma intercalatum]